MEALARLERAQANFIANPTPDNWRELSEARAAYMKAPY